ncbi:MAG: hypothetical protein HZC55_22765 [Verrucomicrobia bacterium]|nr:hypothetical protein [Verrucomicrobiota bacterium]
MTATRYLLSSLLHHRYAYLGVLAGSVLGATVLLGALFSGDSVRATLQQIAAQRTGRATQVLTSGDRFFRAALATDLAGVVPARTAPVLLTRGTAAHASTQARVNHVQLLGVTDAFWAFAPRPPAAPLTPAGPAVAINHALARQLNLATGDTLILRFQKPGILTGNAPIAGGESTLQTLRGTVAAVIDDHSLGRFSLEATQVPPASVFLPIARLQEALDQPGRANLMLLETEAPRETLAAALRRAVRLADYGLSLRWIEAAGAFEVGADRIFLDPEIDAAIVRALPAAQPVTSYLVNEFRVRTLTTPYSIVTATTHAAAPFLPADLGPRDIVLNDWLARDLQAAVGDEVRLTYFQSSAGSALQEQAASFRVRAIIPLQRLAADRAWMPEFPGITNTGSPRDWNPGLPLDLKRIRDQDERYWDEHRGAPKAFLPAEAGQELWSSRWGARTARRIAAPRENEAEITQTLLGALRPELNQLLVRDFRGAAADSAAPAVDFAGLFLGMSFFLILAALGLVAMLFQFCLLQRNREDALLAAVGIPPERLRRWRLAEAVVLLTLGSAAGVPLAALYTRGILRFLETIWAGQGAARFDFAATPASLAGGAGGFLILSLLVLWLSLRRQARRALSIRLAAHAEESAATPRLRRTSVRIAIVAGLVAAIALAVAGRGLPPQGAFFLAGFALLVAGLATCRTWLAGSTGLDPAAPFEPSRLGVLNLKTRRSRSLTVIGLIATAVFMVLSVASFRKQVGSDWLDRTSGTGGFAFFVETTAAQNPARDRLVGRFEIFESHASELGLIVPLRAGAGDNINCFNLNTTAQPRLLAVDAAVLAARGAFPITGTGPAGANGWNLLRPTPADPALPALIDETTLLWALKRKVGDLLSYTDENGRTFPVRIAGTLKDSVFQGYLLVDEAAFLARYPSHPGYSIFLVDAARPGGIAALQPRLAAAVGDVGGRVDTTREVLTAFHQIENTYIAIFNVLGALGVVLGSLGLAIVIARNLRERRGEFAVMAAIGLPPPVLARLVVAEFGRLVLWGIGIGLGAAIVAVWPGLGTLPAAPTLALVGGLLAGILLLNLASGWLVFRWSLRDLRPSTVLGGD